MKNAAKILSLECARIAESVADRNGFVTLRALAQKCGCQIVVRPLLVEAGITKRLDGDLDWIVLLNNEIHPISDEQLEYESHLYPIGARTRNTIAHEIAHAVAIKKFGIDFTTADSHAEKLAEIETAIEKASPLLLISKNNLLARLKSVRTGSEALAELARSAKYFGTSKNTLFIAFSHLSRYNRADFLATPSVTSASWGIAERKGNKIFTRSNWLVSNCHGPTSSPFLKPLLNGKLIEWTIVKSVEGDVSTVISIRRELKGGIREVVALECERNEHSTTKLFFRIPHSQNGLPSALHRLVIPVLTRDSE